MDYIISLDIIWYSWTRKHVSYEQEQTSFEKINDTLSFPYERTITILKNAAYLIDKAEILRKNMVRLESEADKQQQDLLHFVEFEDHFSSYDSKRQLELLHELRVRRRQIKDVKDLLDTYISEPKQLSAKFLEKKNRVYTPRSLNALFDGNRHYW